MGKKKNKFDLSKLVHRGHLNEGDTLCFVSDESKTCQIQRQPDGNYKVLDGKETVTVHAFALKCLGTDPPDHASKWLRTTDGKTLYELWHAEDELEEAA